jgi:hypothetical protein
LAEQKQRKAGEMCDVWPRWRIEARAATWPSMGEVVQRGRSPRGGGSTMDGEQSLACVGSKISVSAKRATKAPYRLIHLYESPAELSPSRCVGPQRWIQDAADSAPHARVLDAARVGGTSACSRRVSMSSGENGGGGRGGVQWVHSSGKPGASCHANPLARGKYKRRLSPLLLFRSSRPSRPRSARLEGGRCESAIVAVGGCRVPACHISTSEAGKTRRTVFECQLEAIADHDVYAFGCDCLEVSLLSLHAIFLPLILSLAVHKATAICNSIRTSDLAPGYQRRPP